ncbi:hypothetical protein ALC56_05915 [Trachymyrmex septentrionalis]|uniref:Uncharacterized protein n=1 Tax=Trachymyrmex septentrionalis TaxID=34720 RepID=A0A195FGQ8_9HYME|nr:hypothetical protein ALC56_05915 [Trachymyrmex septentrionalis]
MCQIYPGYRHSQAGQAQIGRSVIRLRADKLRVAHYESRENAEYFSRFAFQMDILMRFKLLTQKEEKEDGIQDLGRQVVEWGG